MFKIFILILLAFISLLLNSSIDDAARKRSLIFSKTQEIARLIKEQGSLPTDKLFSQEHYRDCDVLTTMVLDQNGNPLPYYNGNSLYKGLVFRFRQKNIYNDMLQVLNSKKSHGWFSYDWPPNKELCHLVREGQYIVISSCKISNTSISGLETFSNSEFIGRKVSSYPNIVIVKGEEPDKMFEKAITEIGGMGRFVKSGNVVVIKPNLVVPKHPKYGATTNPVLIKKIIESAYSSGASSVYVFDRFLSPEDLTLTTTGMKDAIKSSKGIYISSNHEEDYTSISSDNTILKGHKISKLYLEADVIINVPILKSNFLTDMSGAIKNLVGVFWDMPALHRLDLHRAIAEIPLIRKPTLNILDAYRILTSHGPLGFSESDVETRKILLISDDILLLDVAGAKILGIDPKKIEYLKIAESLKYGSTDLKNAVIGRISM